MPLTGCATLGSSRSGSGSACCRTASGGASHRPRRSCWEGRKQGAVAAPGARGQLRQLLRMIPRPSFWWKSGSLMGRTLRQAAAAARSAAQAPLAWASASAAAARAAATARACWGRWRMWRCPASGRRVPAAVCARLSHACPPAWASSTHVAVAVAAGFAAPPTRRALPCSACPALRHPLPADHLCQPHPLPAQPVCGRAAPHRLRRGDVAGGAGLAQGTGQGSGWHLESNDCSSNSLRSAQRCAAHRSPQPAHPCPCCLLFPPMRTSTRRHPTLCRPFASTMPCCGCSPPRSSTNAAWSCRRPAAAPAAAARRQLWQGRRAWAAPTPWAPPSAAPSQAPVAAGGAPSWPAARRRRPPPET